MMRFPLIPSIVCGVGLIGAAIASTWADLDRAFPELPCQDGWAGCLVNGQRIGPDMVRDGSGHPIPSHWRVGWFDMEPTAAFSPIVSLSQYQVKPRPAPAPVVAPDPAPPVAPAPDLAEVDVPEEIEQVDRDAIDEAARARLAEEQARLEAEREAEERVAQVRPRPAPAPAPEVRPRPEPEPAPAPEPAPETRSRPEPAPEVRTRPEPAPAPEPEPAPAPAPAPVVTADDGNCDNAFDLEAVAMMGRMTAGQVAACEARIAASSKQTEKDEVSRLLMRNAKMSGNREKWAKLAKRHLDEISKSDPDLCYAYAIHLNKRKRPPTQVIYWADVALENRTVWTGSTYTKRVYALYKLKAIAAQNLWKAAEGKVTGGDASAQAESEKWRNQTKVFAREWYEYSKKANMDTSVPLQLCSNAAGFTDYCEQG